MYLCAQSAVLCSEASDLGAVSSPFHSMCIELWCVLRCDAEVHAVGCAERHAEEYVGGYTERTAAAQRTQQYMME